MSHFVIHIRVGVFVFINWDGVDLEKYTKARLHGCLYSP